MNKLSVLLPTLGRRSVLNTVKSLCDTVDFPLEIVLVVEENKEIVGEVYNLIKDRKIEFVFKYSEHRMGALNAWNVALSLSSGDMLFPCGDDQLCHPGWFEKVMRAHDEQVKGFGMIAVNDLNLDGNVLGTTLLFDRMFCRDILGGVIAYPYNYFYVDNELNERAKNVGRYYWCKDAIVEHLHWSNNKRQQDEFDSERNLYMELDKQIFLERQRRGFPNNFKPVIS